MKIEELPPTYCIAVTGNHCINCEGYIQYYMRRVEEKRAIHTAVDKGYCIERQCITRPGNRCKHYEEKSNVGVI